MYKWSQISNAKPNLTQVHAFTSIKIGRTYIKLIELIFSLQEQGLKNIENNSLSPHYFSIIFLWCTSFDMPLPADKLPCGVLKSLLDGHKSGTGVLCVGQEMKKEIYVCSQELPEDERFPEISSTPVLFLYDSRMKQKSQFQTLGWGGT